MLDRFLEIIPEDGSYPKGTHYWLVASESLSEDEFLLTETNGKHL